MKKLICLCLALLAMLMFALPVMAVPEDDYAPYDNEEYYDYEDDEPEQTEPPTTLPPPTTTVVPEEPEEAVAESHILLPGCPLDDAHLIVSYAALGVGLLALILAIIALAKGRKDKQNAAGNYKKFF